MRKEILCVIGILLMLIPSISSATPIERIFVRGGLIKFHDKEVTVEDFEMSKYEITNEQYAVFLNARGIGADGVYKDNVLIHAGSVDLQVEYKNKKWQSKQGFNNYPVVMVSYYGAAEYCYWAGGSLPTEMEWFYAAKGGIKSKNYFFAGGNILEQVGWFKGNSARHLHETGKKKPNELGLFDMSGNAWEWCLNNSLKSDTDFCVHMGGSWYADEKAARLDARYGNTPRHFSNSIGFRVVFPADMVLNNNSRFKNYTGKPWNNTFQLIPGKIQCEWYDTGGEGIAYHDTDSINNGSGRLNPANGNFLNEFRMHEGVDISYTKTRDIDNNPYNMVEPIMDQFYVGWTVPGEWINYTVQVNQTGQYTIGLMYTASGDGGISLLLDGKILTDEILIPSTRSEKETIPWRQWHHWNKIDSLTTVRIKKGIHVLTLKTVTNGNMNYDYLEFKLKQ